MATLASDWLKHFLTFLQLFNVICGNFIESKYWIPSKKLLFSGWSLNKYGHPGLWIAETYIFGFSSAYPEWHLTKYYFCYLHMNIIRFTQWLSDPHSEFLGCYGVFAWSQKLCWPKKNFHSKMCQLFYYWNMMLYHAYCIMGLT